MQARPSLRFTRRQLLATLASSAFAAEPRNQSFPLRGIEGQLTPPEMFFVREHFNEPDISLSTWRLRIEGRVDRPLTLSLSDLIESRTTKIEAVLECAGNVAGGSGVSNGLWEGVPLGDLLNQAGAHPEAASILLVGSDHGRLLQSSPVLPYARLVPIDKCRDAKTLIAFQLNGRLLPRQNGFPARALLPAWYGMDSVKWLQRIVVLAKDEVPPEYRASGMDRVYTRAQLPSGANQPLVTRVSVLQVKSVISWPLEGAALPPGQYTVRGFAWSGTPVQGVGFSDDGGRTWRAAWIEAPQKDFGWVRWSVAWTPTPGEHVLLSRASDEAGNLQPLERDRARKDGYELNACTPVPCSVA